MRFGNCYTFAIRQYLKHGGWLILRRSIKAEWVPHMQWAAAGLEVGAERMPSWWAGFRKAMGPDRGYLLWNRSGCYWRARVSSIQIVEYLPPPWVDRLLTNYRLFRIAPWPALVFFGWVRSGEGEQDRTQTIIDDTWP
jgi:hypothetical protein